MMHLIHRTPDTYTIITVATIRVSSHPDFWRSQYALRQLIESEWGQLLLRVSGLAVRIEYVIVEPVDDLEREEER